MNASNNIEESNIKPFNNFKDYRNRAESSLPHWACKYNAKSRPWQKRSNYNSRLGYRTEFQMDRDDILYSRSFRYLAYKRQIFSEKDVESFYTRLTHTLIVSQIARSIGKSLQLDEHLIEAIALGHDLGHAPYGHSGEEGINRFINKNIFPNLYSSYGSNEINKLPLIERVSQEKQLNAKTTSKKPSQKSRKSPRSTQDQQSIFEIKGEPILKQLERDFCCLPNDKKTFNHNAQSYRLIKYLEKSGRGLELSLFTYYGIFRASMSQDDNDDFCLPNECLDNSFASFEAQVVRIADDIAWANHDLTEDCSKTGKRADELLDEYDNKFGTKDLGIHFDEMRVFLLSGTGARYGMFITDLIENNKDKIESNSFLQIGKKPGYRISLSNEFQPILDGMKSIVVSIIRCIKL